MVHQFVSKNVQFVLYGGGAATDAKDGRKCQCCSFCECQSGIDKLVIKTGTTHECDILQGITGIQSVFRGFLHQRIVGDL